MSFRRDARQRKLAPYESMRTLPFNVALADGSLSVEHFWPVHGPACRRMCGDRYRRCGGGEVGAGTLEWMHVAFAAATRLEWMLRNPAW